MKVSKKINGILLLDKSQGLSSNQALQRVKRLYQAEKLGHTGTLDPLATGMLPLCFGQATKLCQFMLEADKAYEAQGLLGVKTSTADALGEIITEVKDFNLTQADLEATLNHFHGLSQQIPSMFSALKYQGQPLYKLARKGLSVERKARDIVIDELALLAFDGKYFRLRVSCSKGTYIRNLVEDIGEHLGVGAHVTELRRLYTSGFKDLPLYGLDELVNMDENERMACLLPMDTAILHLPQVKLTPSQILALRQGRVLSDFSFQETNDSSLDSKEKPFYLRLYDSEDLFLGIAQMGEDSALKVKRLLAFD